MEAVTLVGAEQVAEAGQTIRRAAEQMQLAAGQIDEAQTRYLRQFEELVERMEQAQQPVTNVTNTWDPLFWLAPPFWVMLVVGLMAGSIVGHWAGQ